MSVHPDNTHPIFKHLESGAAEIVTPTLDRSIALSQAISLKRIADALEAIAKGDNDVLGILERRR